MKAQLIRRALVKAEAELRHASRFPRLDEFTAAYIETALWSSTDTVVDEDGHEEYVNLTDYFTYEDINHECLNQMVEDCRRFQEENYADINVESVSSGYSNDMMAGHDFWLTRNGHGAGFWDGDWPEPEATRLTKAAEAFGEIDLYVGDDRTTIYCG